MISAIDARQRYAADDYIDSMKAITHAIMEAAPKSRKVVVNVPTGSTSPPTSYEVTQALREHGFNVELHHDPENGSSELTIDWRG